MVANSVERQQVAREMGHHRHCESRVAPPLDRADVTEERRGLPEHGAGKRAVEADHIVLALQRELVGPEYVVCMRIAQHRQLVPAGPARSV